jgi:hypothetical protein
MKEVTKDVKDDSKDLKNIFTSYSYNINIKVDDDQKELPFPERLAFTLHVSELSRKIFFGLFKLVASESLKDNYTENVDDEFDNVSRVLFRNFNMDHLDDQGSLENSIEKYMHRLNEYLFFFPKILLRGKSEGLTLLEFGIGYEGSIDSIVNHIKKALKALREEKIKFWVTLLKKYKDDKEGFDLEFRTKESRHKKDLDRASRITDEDIKSLM